MDSCIDLVEPGCGPVIIHGDRDEPQRHGTPRAGSGQAREIILAERDGAGEWHTIGGPLSDLDFTDRGLAYDFAEERIKREYGRRFCWTTDPSKARVEVRAGIRGRLGRTAKMLTRPVILTGFL